MAWGQARRRQPQDIRGRIKQAASGLHQVSANVGEQLFQNLKASQQQRMNMMSLGHTIPVQRLFWIAVAFDD
jgi:hypothetical protein